MRANAALWSLVVVLASACAQEDPPYGVARLDTPRRLELVARFSLPLNATPTNAMAFNTNVLPGGEKDDDGDGLSNLWEQHLGTNPQLVDTDGDGINDFLEQELGRSPTEAAVAPCTDLSDADGDGLNGCEEGLLGTRADLYDTDGDGLSDGMEARVGMNPLMDDPDLDYDLDGVTNANEALRHTQVRSLNLADQAYQQDLFTTGSDAQGQMGFELHVTNIQLGPAPGNLVFLQLGITSSAGVRYRLACVRATEAALVQQPVVDVPPWAWTDAAAWNINQCICLPGGC